MISSATHPLKTLNKFQKLTLLMLIGWHHALICTFGKHIDRCCVPQLFELEVRTIENTKWCTSWSIHRLHLKETFRDTWYCMSFHGKRTSEVHHDYMLANMQMYDLTLKWWLMRNRWTRPSPPRQMKRGKRWSDLICLLLYGFFTVSIREGCDSLRWVCELTLICILGINVANKHGRVWYGARKSG